MIGAICNVYGKVSIPIEETNEDARGYKITVIDKAGNADTMELEEYITCVVLGEVSPQFHHEALKAQAIAARTYTLYCIDILGKHSSGAVCMDHNCCQAYCDPEEFLNNGGTQEELNKVSEAVKCTAGQAIYYGTELICATYFASSGGKTEDALEVWGKSYPYLKAVKSTGEEDSGYFSKQAIFTNSEFMEALGVSFTGDPSSWFGIIKYTSGDGIDLIRIGGRLYTGVELRSLLKLRSTIMTFTIKENRILVDTKGYGHRVGMSQHGANAMAKQGCNYSDIINHYYVGTKIQQYTAGN